MNMNVDPETVREIAAAAIRRAYQGRLASCIITELSTRGTWDTEMHAAVESAADTVELSWPDEQQDGAAGRIEVFLDAHRPDNERKSSDVLATLPNPEGRGWRHLTGADLRAVLAERNALAARVAELGEPEVEQRIVTPGGMVYEPTLRDLENQDWWLPGVRLEERQVYPTPWRVAGDAPETAPSATETAGEGVRESVEGNTSSILPQGSSEPEDGRDTAAWCWAPNPNGPLRCGRLRNHEPPHRRGERTWTDDDTEGR